MVRGLNIGEIAEAKAELRGKLPIVAELRIYVLIDELLELRSENERLHQRVSKLEWAAQRAKAYGAAGQTPSHKEMHDADIRMGDAFESVNFLRPAE